MKIYLHILTFLNTDIALCAGSWNPSPVKTRACCLSCMINIMVADDLTTKESRRYFTNVLQALQNNLAKIYNARNHIYGKNFKLELCTCAQSMALGTHTKFQLEILIRSIISATPKSRKNILESLLNISAIPQRASVIVQASLSFYK